MPGVIEFECLNCGRQMAVPESAVGRRVTCATCQTIIAVPPVSMKFSGPRDVEVLYSADQTDRGRMASQQVAAWPSQSGQTLSEHQVLSDIPGFRMHVNSSNPDQPGMSFQFHTQSTGFGCLGAMAIVCGVCSLSVAWIPLVGLLCIPIAGFGILFALFGVLASLSHRGRGLIASLCGGALCAGAIWLSMALTSALARLANPS